MSFVIGASLALGVGLFATWIGFDRDRSFYPAVMLVIASYYVLFALIGGSSHSLLTECAVMAAFLVAVIAGFKRTLWLVVAALAAHGVLDFVHPQLISNPGVPAWWPDFCLAYDLVAACYLATLLTVSGRLTERGNEGARTHSVLGGREPVALQRSSR
jgi:hypothetical protein